LLTDSCGLSARSMTIAALPHLRARLGRRGLYAAGVLAFAAVASLIFLGPSREALRERRCDKATMQAVQLINTTLNSLSATARVIAGAMPAAASSDDAARLLAEAVRSSSVYSVELVDASGKTRLMRHHDAGVTSNPAQFTEIGMHRNWDEVALLRNSVGAQSLAQLALRALTPAAEDGSRQQILITLRCRTLPGITGGFESAWLMATGGALVFKPLTSGDKGEAEAVGRAWLNLRSTQVSGHFQVEMEGGPHVMYYRRLPDWPVSLVIDGGPAALPLIVPGSELSVGLGLAAVLLGGLALFLVFDGARRTRSQPPPARLRVGMGGDGLSDEARMLAGIVALEVSNLLTIVSIEVETVSQLHPQNAAIGRISRSVASAATRGAGLTQHLLSFAEQAMLRPKLVDVGIKIADCYDELLTHIAPGQVLQLHLPEYGERPALAHVDSDVLCTSLGMLLRHAAAMTGAAAQIQVKVGHAVQDGKRVVRVDVTDGCHEKGSECLHQIGGDGSSLKLDEPHLGLGLAAVAGFARQSGGCLWWDGRQGQGANASLCFPSVDETVGVHSTILPFPAPSATGVPATTTGQRPARILLVDDDVLVRRGIAARLSAMGHDVIEATNVSYAQRIGAKGVDLLLTETVLSGDIDGSSLAAHLRRRAPRLPVVFMSGFMTAGQPDAMRCDNLTSFVRKPINTQELCTVIDGLLAMREPMLAEAAD